LNRRRFLVSAAASAAALAVERCASPRAAGRSPDASRRFADRLPGSGFPAGCDLAPVRVSPDREIRTIAGLRPYRPSGFVVRAEKLGDTLVVHNYGHGGAGITLSWGTSAQAVELLPPEQRGPVAVLGCGAVGLATARLLQERGREVTIYAKDLPPNTTSNVAGGQWFPFFVADSPRRTPEFLRQLVSACEFAYRRYQTLVGPAYGVRWIRNYMLGSEPWREEGLTGMRGPLAAFLPEMRDLSRDEHPFPDAPFPRVRQFDGMLVEPHVYLARMLSDVRGAGGTVRVQEIADREAVRALPERIVFNCTGLGARALFGDEELVPIKGQLTFLLPQPEIGYTILMGSNYMFPRSDGILLGGTHEEGVWSLDPDPAARARILGEQQRFFEGFRGC
jgi:glycine/D-amino acid oxidase-like deaminating enzyme